MFDSELKLGQNRVVIFCGLVKPNSLAVIPRNSGASSFECVGRELQMFIDRINIYTAFLNA